MLYALPYFWRNGLTKLPSWPLIPFVAQTELEFVVLLVLPPKLGITVPYHQARLSFCPKHSISVLATATVILLTSLLSLMPQNLCSTNVPFLFQGFVCIFCCFILLCFAWHFKSWVLIFFSSYQVWVKADIDFFNSMLHLPWEQHLLFLPLGVQSKLSNV